MNEQFIAQLNYLYIAFNTVMTGTTASIFFDTYSKSKNKTDLNVGIFSLVICLIGVFIMLNM